jgi:hypothetical protein
MKAFVKYRLAILVLGILVGTVQAAPLESFVEAKGPQGPLQGTMLALQTGKGPVVLIIPGSGPTDRDGNSPLGVHASTYRLLAEGPPQRG